MTPPLPYKLQINLHIKELDLHSLSEQVFETCVQFNVILIKIAVKFFGPEDLSNTNKLWRKKKKNILVFNDNALFFIESIVKFYDV